jgi:hypothetical protein
MQAGGKTTGVSVAPSSPSRTRSPEPQVLGEALVDDAPTATPTRGVADVDAKAAPYAKHIASRTS